MARPKKTADQDTTKDNTIMTTPENQSNPASTAEEFDFDTFELKTVEDYKTWNLHARKAYRKAKIQNPKCNPPIPCKAPPAHLHRTVKVKFQRFDQPENTLKVKRRTQEIDYEGELMPGHIYDLPVPIVKYLNSLSTPIFAEVPKEGGQPGEKETKQVGERSRFSCQILEFN